MGGGDAAMQDKEEIVAAITRLFTCQLSTSQTSEHFLSELKDLKFCMWILLKKVVGRAVCDAITGIGDWVPRF
jgi:hypothetical protein